MKQYLIGCYNSLNDFVRPLLSRHGVNKINYNFTTIAKTDINIDCYLFCVNLYGTDYGMFYVLIHGNRKLLKPMINIYGF